MHQVLVVDNEPQVRRMLAEVLRASGYRVVVARSGPEAVEIAAVSPPDLVMLDVNMPGMDGWETLARLLAAVPDTRVLMMSGSECAEDAIARGAAGFIAKPYRPAEVLRQVASALEAPATPAADAAAG